MSKRLDLHNRGEVVVALTLDGDGRPVLDIPSRGHIDLEDLLEQLPDRFYEGHSAGRTRVIRLDGHDEMRLEAIMIELGDT